MIQAFTKGSLRKDFKTAVVLGVIVVVCHILGMVSVLIMYVSLKSKMFELFALSVTVVLFLIWQILNLFKLKDNYQQLPTNKSRIWL